MVSTVKVRAAGTGQSLRLRFRRVGVPPALSPLENAPLLLRRISHLPAGRPSPRPLYCFLELGLIVSSSSSVSDPPVLIVTALPFPSGRGNAAGKLFRGFFLFPFPLPPSAPSNENPTFDATALCHGRPPSSPKWLLSFFTGVPGGFFALGCRGLPTCL